MHRSGMLIETTFSLCIVLFLTIPRAPNFKFPSADIIGVDNSTVSFSRSPTNFSFAGSVNMIGTLQLDTLSFQVLTPRPFQPTPHHLTFPCTLPTLISPSRILRPTRRSRQGIGGIKNSRGAMRSLSVCPCNSRTQASIPVILPVSFSLRPGL
jgi:hypothetical protein